jgi:pantothenate kinase
MVAKSARLADPLVELLALLDASAQRKGARQRVVVALAGLPGSGKSTIASQWAQAINAPRGANTALALGMDGFHLSRAQLAQFADPQAALTRRGAPWKFDPTAFVQNLRAIKTPDLLPQSTQTWPGFEHGVGDPVAAAIQVPPDVQLVIVEGLYLLHHGHGWHEGPEWDGLFDRAWFLNVPLKLAMQRLVARHMASHGVSRAQAQQRLADNDRLNADIVLQSRDRAQALV